MPPDAQPYAQDNRKTGKRKDLRNFDTFFHSGFASHFRAGGSSYSTEEYDPLAALLPGRLSEWIPHVARFWFQKRHPFRDFAEPGHGNGIYPLKPAVSVSVVGDWGTGTDEAQLVADRVREFHPDFTIHLGDVYYVGDKTEIDEHFLGLKTSPYEPVRWPIGTNGSFALVGNHEMYARGSGFFGSILPRMGLRQNSAGSDNAGWGAGQWASFFCLENDFWRILGIDTGYASTKFDWGKMPVLQRSKWLRTTTHLKPKCTIPEPQLAWLANVVRPDQDRRGLILLSHHGSYSAFSDWYQIPARQLKQIIHRPAIWFWGHEHKLAIYDKFNAPGGLESYGRCVGHGGMPVERGRAPDLDCPWLAWDNRRYRNGEDIDVGYNGHANLQFDGPELRVEYVDLHGLSLFREDWHVDLTSGELRGPNLRKLTSDLDVHIRQR